MQCGSLVVRLSNRWGVGPVIEVGGKAAMIEPDSRKNRSRRLRKKLRVGEFQEFGFEVALELVAGLDDEGGEAFVDRFLAEVIEPNGMCYGGWDRGGYVASYGRGGLSEAHRQHVIPRLEAVPEVKAFVVHPLSDSWHGPAE